MNIDDYTEEQKKAAIAYATGAKYSGQDWTWLRDRVEGQRGHLRGTLKQNTSLHEDLRAARKTIEELRENVEALFKALEEEKERTGATVILAPRLCSGNHSGDNCAWLGSSRVSEISNDVTIGELCDIPKEEREFSDRQGSSEVV